MSAAAPELCLDPRRVLTLTPFYPRASDSAAGCFVADPLSRFVEWGVSSDVLAVQPFYRGRAQPSPDAPRAAWVQFPSLPGGIGLATAGGFLSATLKSKVRSLLHSHAINLIHAHAALPCGHAAMLLGRKFGIPFVVTVHGRDVFFTNQVGGYSGRACERIARQVYRSAQRAICISKKVASELASGIGPSATTTVIYNGVDSDVFSPLESSPESRTILSVGNLIPSKGYELLLRAFAVVYRRYPGISCAIIGDGPERSRLGKLARDLNIASKVHFLGRQSRKQVAEAMQRCALFALPSQYEGLGCVYLEAMSTAKPVIACRGQGIAEVIQHGKNGWLIDPNDLPQLVSALSMLLESSSLRQKMGAAARNTVLQNFTLHHQAARLAQIYRECGV